MNFDDDDDDSDILDDSLLARFGLTDEVPTKKGSRDNLLGISTVDKEEQLVKQSLESKW